MHTVPFTQIHSTVYAIIGTLETLRAVREYTPKPNRTRKKKNKTTKRDNESEQTHCNTYEPIFFFLTNFWMRFYSNFQLHNVIEIRKKYSCKSRLNTNHRPFMVRFQWTKCWSIISRWSNWFSSFQRLTHKLRKFLFFSPNRLSHSLSFSLRQTARQTSTEREKIV